MNESERLDYWRNKTGKETPELEDICLDDYDYDDNYDEARDYLNED
jgi:hypothetical protein